VNPGDKEGRGDRRRGVLRTAFILLAIVVAIYAIFVGRGVYNYFMT